MDTLSASTTSTIATEVLTSTISLYGNDFLGFGIAGLIILFAISSTLRLLRIVVYGGDPDSEDSGEVREIPKNSGSRIELEAASARFGTSRVRSTASATGDLERD